MGQGEGRAKASSPWPWYSGKSVGLEIRKPGFALGSVINLSELRFSFSK